MAIVANLTKWLVLNMYLPSWVMTGTCPDNPLHTFHSGLPEQRLSGVSSEAELTVTSSLRLVITHVGTPAGTLQPCESLLKSRHGMLLKLTMKAGSLELPMLLRYPRLLGMDTTIQAQSDRRAHRNR